MSDCLPYFKALADETRLRLFNILCQHELNVNELVSILDMGQSRISRHLKILASSGLLEWRREGLWVFYTTAQKGEAHTFIESILPCMSKDAALLADLEMARSLVEERVQHTKQFFNRIAEDWDKLSREVLGGFDLPKAVVELMPKCEVAVDLGCGTGNVLLAMLGKATNLIGVDGSPRMLELARRRFIADAERVSLRIGDLSHLPLRDKEVDFACLNMVLHHLDFPSDILKEIKRILTPDALLVVTDFDKHSDETMRLEYGDRWLGFEAETLQGHLERAGFTILSSGLAPVERGLALHLIQAKPIL